MPYDNLVNGSCFRFEKELSDTVISHAGRHITYWCMKRGGLLRYLRSTERSTAMFYDAVLCIWHGEIAQAFIKCTALVLIFLARGNKKKYKYFKNNCIFIW